MLLSAICCVAIRGWVLLPPATTDNIFPTLHQPVEILFDRWGVPHIYAKDTDDLFFAQGWITARDRLFQLDLWRRIGSGRLADASAPSAEPPRPTAPPLRRGRARVPSGILGSYSAASGAVRFPGQQGSNNWVVDGSMSATGNPLLANDPHRTIQIPSLRKTVHLVAPGWNVIGAGEPALPGIALGHNEKIAFGFTIVGMDQQDLYIEKLKPDDPAQYLYRGEWRKMEIEHDDIPVKGSSPQSVELHYTIHVPVIYADKCHSRAYP